jgi:peptide/nickel transport system permease protein
MYKYILFRVIQSILVILTVLILVFVLGRLGSNDPAIMMAGPNATQEDIQAIRQTFGLDKPILVQLGYYLREVVQGNFGYSYHWQEPAMGLVLSRIPATLLLSVVAMIIGWVTALTLGVLAAVKRGTWIDTLCRGWIFFGQSMPGFWLGLMLVILFSVNLGWLPSSGFGGLDSHLILPAVTIGVLVSAGLTRLTRAGMINILDTEYIKMARAKGLPESMVLFKHALKNASIPLVTIMGPMLASLFSGAVVIESVFAWPGMGRLGLQAVLSSDFPVVQAVVFLSTTILVLGNLLVDVLYCYVDPRIRLT